MSNQTIYVDASTLEAIYSELDRPIRDMPFETAASLGLCFRCGFDHSEVKTHGWALKIHDRGMNCRCNDFTFSVPVADRTSRLGPLA